MLRVLWGPPERRVMLRQMPGGKLLQHISAGVVFVVAAGLTRSSRETVVHATPVVKLPRILRIADLDVP
jgi:hypothetical protein